MRTVLCPFDSSYDASRLVYGTIDNLAIFRKVRSPVDVLLIAMTPPPVPPTPPTPPTPTPDPTPPTPTPVPTPPTPTPTPTPVPPTPTPDPTPPVPTPPTPTPAPTPDPTPAPTPASDSSATDAAVLQQKIAAMQSIIDAVHSNKTASENVSNLIDSNQNFIIAKLLVAKTWVKQHLYISGALLCFSAVGGTYVFQNYLNASQQSVVLSILAKLESLFTQAAPLLLATTASVSTNVSVVLNSTISTSLASSVDSNGDVVSLFQGTSGTPGPLKDYAIVQVDNAGTSGLVLTEAVEFAKISSNAALSSISSINSNYASFSTAFNLLNQAQQTDLLSFIIALEAKNSGNVYLTLASVLGKPSTASTNMPSTASSTTPAVVS